MEYLNIISQLHEKLEHSSIEIDERTKELAEKILPQSKHFLKGKLPIKPLIELDDRNDLTPRANTTNLPEITSNTCSHFVNEVTNFPWGNVTFDDFLN